jgi:hypothetical protein
MSELAIADDRQHRRDCWQYKVQAAHVSEQVTQQVTSPQFSHEANSYGDLIEALRRRAEQLDISRSTIDSLAGIADGLASKILGLGQSKRLGLETLGSVLQAMSLRIVVEHDDEAYESMRHRYVKRDGPHTVSASKGHAGGEKESLARVDARAAILQAQEEAREAQKKALEAIRDAESAAARVVKMKAEKLRKKIPGRKGGK